MNSLQDFTNCQYWGMGGRYVVDPATGLRTPAPPDDESIAPDLAVTVNPAADDASATDPATQPVKPLKEKKNV
jgi:hypothetical protein